MKALLVVFVTMVLMSCSSDTNQPPTSTPPLPMDTLWAMDRTWDDGMAEVATYEATRTIYGKRRTYELTMITVKEAFNREFMTKSDSYERTDLFTVMKVNLFARIQTNIYPYHYLTSIFFPRTAPHRVEKITSGSQEWCGNTFKRVQRTDSSYGYAFDSYWDGEGAGIRTLPNNVWFEDQLFYTLRSVDFSNARTFSMKVLPTIITNKAALDSAQPATFTVHEDRVDPSTLGTITTIPEQPCWRIDMRINGNTVASWWFSQDPQHKLLQFQHADGRTMKLVKVERNTYWKSE